jgi:hypothetical protein
MPSVFCFLFSAFCFLLSAFLSSRENVQENIQFRIKCINEISNGSDERG